MKRLILLFMILLSSLIFAKEKELNTNYFRFVYDENYEEEAIELTKSMDTIANEQFKFFNFIPSEKIVVLLRDITDDETSYVLDNTIFLYPNSINTFELEKTYDDWYIYVFTHELTHVIINRKVGGVFKAVPIFRYNLHQLFMPSWYQEGLAIYSEVKFNEDRISGRELSKKFEMPLKAEVLEKDFKGLTLANGMYFNNDNYTHGYSFIKFFADTYGEEALKEVIEKASNHQIMQPFEAFLDVANINTEEEMYNQWLKYLTEKYKPKKNVREGKTLVHISLGNKKNLIVRNNELYYSDVYYGKNFKDRKKGIYKYNLSDQEEKKITDDVPVNGFDIGGGDLYYSTLMNDPLNQTSFAETFKMHRKKDKYKSPKIMNLKRAINFVYLDDEIAYVYREKEKTGLKTLSGKILISPREGYIFQKLFYDELNQFIYFAATKVDEKISYIYEFNMLTYEIKKIVKGYSPFIEGNDLYFENSKNGTFNIFKYNFETQDIFQITNVKYGAFEPQILDNNLYFLNYEENGSTINELKKEKFLNKTVRENDFDEKKIEEDKHKVSFERAFDRDSLKIKRFRNNFSYRYGYLVPGELSLTYSDQFWEKYLTIGFSSYLTAGSETESDNNVYYGTENTNENSGVFAQYKDSKWTLYGEAASKNYAKLTFTYPIMLDKNKMSWMFMELSSDSKSEKSIDFYLNKNFLFLSKNDKLGIKRTFDDEDSDLNEIYMESPILSLYYFWSDKTRQMNGELDKINFINLDGFENSLLRYNINAKQMVIAKTSLGKMYPIYRGSISGTFSVQNYFASVDLYYMAWSGLTQRLIYNASIGGNGFIFTSLPLTLTTGIMDQLDVEKGEFVDDSSIIYIKYMFLF